MYNYGKTTFFHPGCGKITAHTPPFSTYTDKEEHLKKEEAS